MTENGQTSANGTSTSTFRKLADGRPVRSGQLGGVSLNVDGVEREELEVDVLLVGAGADTFACALRLERAAQVKVEALAIELLETAEDFGYH
ncbi:MAG: hypothetical protein AAFZ65_20300, partial [Planctomycetota bacterium]